MTYYWICPDCEREYELRKRITQRVRTCSHCGTPMLLEEIDQCTEFKEEEFRRSREEADRLWEEQERQWEEQERQQQEEERARLAFEQEERRRKRAARELLERERRARIKQQQQARLNLITAIFAPFLIFIILAILISIVFF